MHGRAIKTTPYGARNYNCRNAVVCTFTYTHTHTQTHDYWSFKGKLYARNFIRRSGNTIKIQQRIAGFFLLRQTKFITKGRQENLQKSE